MQRAQRVADSEREHLPADLVVAIDNLSVVFRGLGDRVHDLAAEVAGRPGLDDWVLMSIVISAREFGEVLRTHVAGSFELWSNAPSEFEQPDEAGAEEEGDGAAS